MTNDVRTHDYWNALIGERESATFLGLSVRTVQGLRQKGGGPPFVRISTRCVKYRRGDLKSWADGRVVTSTSDRTEAAQEISVADIR